MFPGAATQISGTRVWAAQYQRIRANYVTLKPGMEFPTNCSLISIFSVQGQSGETNTANVVVTNDLAGEEVGIEEGDAEILNEEYWQDFEKEAGLRDAKFAAETLVE
jgi:hypothetical protein